MQRRRMELLLRQAQNGDAMAQQEVALFVFEEFHWRVLKMHSNDPAIALEDFEMTFFEGIMAFVPKADGRGDDFYHIGQRGYWACQSMVRQVKSQMEGRVFGRAWMDEEGEDYMARVPDPQAEFAERTINAIVAKDTVRLITSLPLKVRSRQALTILVDGSAGDPDEPGFNQRLAAEMGVSAQRASQIMAELRDEISEQVPPS